MAENQKLVDEMFKNNLQYDTPLKNHLGFVCKKKLRAIIRNYCLYCHCCIANGIELLSSKAIRKLNRLFIL